MAGGEAKIVGEAQPIGAYFSGQGSGTDYVLTR